MRRPTALVAEDAEDDCAVPVEEPVGVVAPVDVTDEPEVADGSVLEVPADSVVVSR